MALIVGIVSSLLDKAHPPVAYLVVLTVLVIGYCIWTIFATEKVTGGIDAGTVARRRYSIRWIVAFNLAAIAALAGAWGFVYREHIRYSRQADYVLGGPRVLVSTDIAWQLLTYKTPEAQTTDTVAGELASILSGLPYRVVVLPRRELADFPSSPRDKAAFHGIGEQSALVLKGTLPFSEPRALQVVEDLGKKAQHREGPDVSLPAIRLLGLETLARVLSPTVSIPASLDQEQRVAVTRLALRYILGLALYVDDNPAAARLFLDMVDLGETLPHMENARLGESYLFVALYFANRWPDNALRSIALARLLAPKNQQIAATEIWLALAAGRAAQAEQLLKGIVSFPDDPVLGDWLNGEYLWAKKDYEGAIRLYEKALNNEQDNTTSQEMHVKAAFGYAMSKRLDPKTAGAGIIRHLEDARQLSDLFVYSALQGYGWALLSEAEQSNVAYERAKSLIDPSLPTQRREEALEFVANWQAKGFLKLQQPLRAREAIERFVGNPKDSQKPDLLEQFGEIMLDVAGFTGRPEEFEAAEAYFDRVIELEPRNGVAHHYKGVALAMRAQNTPNSDAEGKRRLRESARSELLLAIRLGEERTVTHAAIAALYEADGDKVNAEKHWGRYCELSGGDVTCLEHQADNLLEAGDVLEKKGDLPGALKASRDRLAIIRRLVSDDPKNAELQRKLSLSYAIIGNLLAKQDNLADALKCYEDGLAIVVSWASKDSDNAAWQDLLSSFYSDIGDVLRDQQSLPAALKSYRDSLVITQRLVKSADRETNELQPLIERIGSLAYLFVLARDFGTGLDAADQSIALAPNLVWLYINRAHALMFLGRTEEARSLYLQFRNEVQVQSNKSWRSAVLDDFKELRKAGLENPLMTEIEIAFTPHG